MVPRCSDKISRVSSYSSSLTGLCFRLQGYHLLWPDFPDCSTSTHPITTTGLVPVRSPLLGESRLISFPPVTEMFQFTGFAPYTYEFSVRYLLRGGFPHSEIAGSKLVCQLADAYRRLPRPSSPSTAKASAICAYSHDLASSRVVRGWAGGWWSQPGSNRRPPGCKPGALPAELWPLVHGPKSPAGKKRGSCPPRTTSLVGLGGVAPPTSPLSGVRSN